MLSFIGAFLCALLSGLGVGGGGIFIVFLNLFSDLPQLTAQGINLLFFLFSSGSAVCVHLRHRTIYGTAVLTMAAFGIIGSLLGLFLARILSEQILRKIFGMLLVVSGILTLQKKEERNLSESIRK